MFLSRERVHLFGRMTTKPLQRLRCQHHPASLFVEGWVPGFNMYVDVHTSLFEGPGPNKA